MKILFWKMEKKVKEDLQVTEPLILNSQSQMAGDFIIQTDVKIDGFVEGNLTTTKMVIVGENGYLKGNLKCNSLNVFGTFEGISEVKESATLQAHSRYLGKLTAPVISIFAGCHITAHINRDHKSQGGDPESSNKSHPQAKEGKGIVDEADVKSDSGSANSPSKNGSSFLFTKLNNKI